MHVHTSTHTHTVSPPNPKGDHPTHDVRPFAGRYRQHPAGRGDRRLEPAAPEPAAEVRGGGRAVVPPGPLPVLQLQWSYCHKAMWRCCTPRRPPAHTGGGDAEATAVSIGLVARHVNGQLKIFDADTNIEILDVGSHQKRKHANLRMAMVQVPSVDGGGSADAPQQPCVEQVGRAFAYVCVCGMCVCGRKLCAWVRAWSGNRHTLRLRRGQIQIEKRQYDAPVCGCAGVRGAGCGCARC